MTDVLRIIDLLHDAKISDSDLLEIKQCHPRQIASECLEIPVWKVKYSYCTQRNNQKVAAKYLFLEEESWDKVESEFMKHMKNLNEKYPERKLSNVQILEANFMGKLTLELE